MSLGRAIRYPKKRRGYRPTTLFELGTDYETPCGRRIHDSLVSLKRRHNAMVQQLADWGMTVPENFDHYQQDVLKLYGRAKKCFGPRASAALLDLLKRDVGFLQRTRTMTPQQAKIVARQYKKE